VAEPASVLCCPDCGSVNVVKDGMRNEYDPPVQRYLCKNCLKRFGVRNSGNLHFLELEENPNMVCPTSAERQVGEFLQESKNLTEVARQEQAQREGTQQRVEKTGKIFEFSWWMQKRGYRESTIFTNTKVLSTLEKRGANLLDLESIKTVIAMQPWSASQKHKTVAIYTLFLRMLGKTWEPPIYRPIPRIPFIPIEKEIDDLIAGSGRKLSAYLQLLKETGMRSGEADQLRWMDLDLERNIVSITPEKNGYPRILPLSSKCIGMLRNLKRASDKVFGTLSSNCMRISLCNARKKLARKLNNSRLEQIHFHTIRHWKATALYHQTKDILYVKQFMGHRRIESTLVYVQIENALFQHASEDFTCKIAQTSDEARQLIEVGFEYVMQKDSLAYFRKRK
jgi:integrase